MGGFERALVRSSLVWQESLRRHHVATASTLQALVAHCGGIGEVAKDLLGDDLTEDLLAEFGLLVDAASRFAAHEREALAKLSDTEVAVSIVLNKNVVDSKLVVAEVSKEEVTEARWPSRLKRRAADSSFPCREAEDKKRAAWVARAGDLVQEAGLPLAAIAARSADPAAALCRVGQGRRLRTIVKKVVTWRKAREWFLAAVGSPWPRSTEDMLEYLEARAAEPCAKSVLRTVLGALSFLERGGGVPERSQISHDMVLRSAIDEMTAQLGSSGPRKRKAPQYPLALVHSLEFAVVNEALPNYDRMYAWWMLVRTWSSLRFDDHRGLMPAEMDMKNGHLTAVLTRTKTSGQDKSVEALPVHVSSKAFLGISTWLAVGFGLWQQVPLDRDCFLVMPDPVRQGTVKVEVTYADAITMTKAMLMSLTRPSSTGGDATQEEKLFLGTEVVSFWTEHSARASMASWVSCLAEFPADWCDLLGRWGASRGEGYVRTHRSRVHMMQEAVAKHFQMDRDAAATFGEDELLDKITAHMKAKGVAEQDMDEQILRLALLTKVVPPIAPEAGALLPVPRDEVSDEEEIKVVGLKCAEKFDDGLFVVSVDGNRRRLHRIGLCHRIPGVHYKDYEVLGPVMPESGYTAKCGHCWPKVASRPSTPSSSSASSPPSSEGEA